MIVITGGAGFIGSNLAAALETHNSGAHAGEMVICDKLGADGKWRNLAKREIAAFIDPDDLFPFLDAHANEISIIFHMGAISDTTASDGDLLIETNFALPLRLWNWCASHGVRMIYASSAATYGDGGEGFEDDFSTAALARLRPLNAYGWSKHLFDRCVARIIELGGPSPSQWVGLKFFNVFGPNEYHKGSQQSVAVQIFRAAKAGNPARLFKSHHPDYADGGQLRDFIWVGDCTDVMLWLLDHPDVNGLFNLGTARARSFADLAAAVFDALGRAPKIDYVDTPIEIREKYQYFTEARMDQLRQAGYAAPFTPLEDGVGRYVRDYLDRDDPYR
ncbi:MAG: ADP-glyceromanno-heptose 6-epimerase [Alphaproteobacteria bacterium]